MPATTAIHTGSGVYAATAATSSTAASPATTYAILTKSRVGVIEKMGVSPSRLIAWGGGAWSRARTATLVSTSSPMPAPHFRQNLAVSEFSPPHFSQNIGHDYPISADGFPSFARMGRVSRSISRNGDASPWLSKTYE